jgi:hypothetical protein
MVLDEPHLHETTAHCSWVCLEPDCDYIAWLAWDLAFNPGLYGKGYDQIIIDDPEEP